MEWVGDALVVAARQQASCDLAGETALVNLKTGMYYSLNPVGSMVWNLVQQPTTLDQIRDAVLAEYEVDRSRCESDLMMLLEELAGAGLIEVLDRQER